MQCSPREAENGMVHPQNNSKEEQPGSIEHIVVFSYWSGELPLNSLLHFYSFRKVNPMTPYILYLESDPGFEGKIPGNLLSILNELKIQIKQVSLNEIQKDFPGLKQPRYLKVYSMIFFRKFRNFVLRFILSPIGKILARNGIAKIGNLYTHEIFGFTPNHRSFLSLSYDNLTFRSDIFRIVKLLDHSDTGVLYLDLDIFVNAEITNSKFAKSFVFKWDKYEFANNAGIYLQSKDLRFRSYLREYLLSGKPLQGWFLFSEGALAKMNLLCLPCEITDPFWSNCMMDFLSPVDFFKSYSSSFFNFNEVISNFWFAHWHNNWHSEIEIGSMYDLCSQHVGLDWKI